MKLGERLHITTGEILALRFHDKRDIYFLSNMHRPKLVVTSRKERDGNNIMREQLVDDYNQSMGYMDKNDAMICKHIFVR